MMTPDLMNAMIACGMRPRCYPGPTNEPVDLDPETLRLRASNGADPALLGYVVVRDNEVQAEYGFYDVAWVYTHEAATTTPTAQRIRSMLRAALEELVRRPTGFADGGIVKHFVQRALLHATE
jgi:hypothetical protein